MASYQARQRDPLLDSNTQAMLERRGKELLGFGLLILALLTALMLASYSPEDPSWLAATDEPAQNLLGRFGASLAAPLIVVAGLGSWGIAVLLAGWGLRFMLHVGEERIIQRIIFAPIAIALASVYASTHVPGPDWGHSFGLGGLFGDTVLGAILGVAPVSAAFGLKLISALVAVASMAMAAHVLGFTREELRAVGKFLLLGIIMAYVAVLRLFGLGATGSLRLARALHGRAAGRRAARVLQAERAEEPPAQPFHPVEEPPLTQPRVRRAVAPEAAPSGAGPAAFAPPQPAPDATSARHNRKGGLLSRMPSLIRRTAEPQAPGAAPAPEAAPGTPEAAGNPEIREKIAEVIRNRIARRKAMQAEAARAEPPLTSRHAHGPEPMILTPAHEQTQPEMPHAGLPSPEPLLARPTFETEDQITTYTLPGAPQTPSRKVVQHPPRKAPRPSRKARAEAQPTLFAEEEAATYSTPPLSLLANPVDVPRQQLSDEALEQNARMLESVLDDYGVKGEIVSVRPGPVVTMYELEPAPGLKASRVIGLADDIARSMSALSARVSTVPGRSVIGIELPNAHREKVLLREILSSRDFGDSTMRLPLALGKDIGGDPVVENLAKMPHLLIAGTTGSGKSVAINTMILSLLYKLSPEECRLIMIDPKMLELSVYDGIPHLLSPVVTDPKKAVVALKWVVGEMEERYRKMSKMGVRNIEGYNAKVREALARGEMFTRTVQTGFDEATGEPVFETEELTPETLPYIVVVVDEMADLMMVAGKEIEACIQRLAQMARASGIHLIMATQRPSVDVITGTIKANFPTRISFQVTSKVDSRTILGEQGAEQLLGMGDMLYMAGGARITRVHGPFVSDEEVEEIVNHLKAWGPPEYVGGVLEGPDEDKESDIDLVLGLGGNTGSEDALYDQAVQIVIRDRKCSTSYIQRKLAIGYNKAARLVEQMEEEGLVSPANHVGKREILVPEPQ